MTVGLARNDGRPAAALPRLLEKLCTFAVGTCFAVSCNAPRVQASPDATLAPEVDAGSLPPVSVVWRPAEPGPRARNVLLVFIEDQGLQLSAVGTPGLSTPSLDALVAGGAFYPNAWTTLASCTGSKATVFTGLHNHQTGAVGNVNEFVGTAEELTADNPSWYAAPDSAYHRYAIREDVPTLIELLREAGYTTGLQNKFHLAPHTKFPFDEWRGPSAAHYEDVAGFIARARTLERDWFLVHVVSEPHRPYVDSLAEGLELELDAVAPPAHLPDTELVRRDWAEYLASIESGDDELGDVLRALDDSGQADRTLVVLMGDHGPSYHRGKFTTYDLGLRVPLVVRGPGVPARTRADLLSAVDLMPTMLDFLGLDVPVYADGVSHYARLTGASRVSPRSHAVGVANSDRSITDGRFRLVFMPDAEDTKLPADTTAALPWRNRVYDHVRDNEHTEGFERAFRLLDLADASLPEYTRPRFELFDLEADPWEVDDLADAPDHSFEFEVLRAALVDWMDRTKDSGPQP